MSGPAAVSGEFPVLPELMDAAAAQIGAREAYVDGERRVTFAEWMRAADGVAAALVERGVGRGDVVALWFDGTVDYAIAYAAVVRIGAVATGINPRLGPARWMRSSAAAGRVSSSPPTTPWFRMA